MKKNLSIVSIIFVFTILLSCNKHPRNSIFQVNHIKDVEYVDVPYNVLQVQSRVETNRTSSYFCYYNPKDNTLNINLDLKHNNVIPLQKIVKKKPAASDFFVHSLDSIYYFDDDLSNFILFDLSGQIIQKYSFAPKHPPNPTISNFFVVSEQLYYSWLPAIDLTTRLKRKNAFSQIFPICVLSLNQPINSNSYSFFGSYPIDYQAGNNYYNFGPDIFLGLENQIVISFESDHNIYIYKNSNLIKKKLSKSNFIDNFVDISDEDLSNLSYCQTYQGQEPSYKRIIVDTYKKRYYRVTKQRIDIMKSDVNHLNWSLIIMNEKFDVIGEALFPYSEYMPDIIIPSENGILIKKTANSEKETYGDLILSLIKTSK